MEYPLFVVQFKQEHDPSTMYWCFAVVLTRSTARLYGIQGNRATQTYTYRTWTKKLWATSPHLCGGFRVGTVLHDQLSLLSETLGTVSTSTKGTDEYSDCQTWVVSALRGPLKDAGMVFPGTNKALIEKELDADYKRWEEGLDAAYERHDILSKLPEEP